MAIVAFLRELWRHRRLVLLGFVLALAAFLLIMYRVTPGLPPQLESRQYEVGVASGAVLIDSQSSQTVDLGSGDGAITVDVASLAARAKLLANLLATRPLRDEIAAMSGVRPDLLITELSSTTEEGLPLAPAADVAVERDDPRANVLSLQTSETVPIITVNAQAPTEETASRLAASTVTRLSRYLEAVAADNSVPDSRKLVMRQLGEPTSATSVRGPGKASAAAAFVLLLTLWCAAVLGVMALLKAWRQTVVQEAREHARVFRGGPAAARLRPPPDPQDDAPGAALPLRVREGADDEPGVTPAAKPASRVA
jgi:hypothetical protein